MQRPSAEATDAAGASPIRPETQSLAATPTLDASVPAARRPRDAVRAAVGRLVMRLRRLARRVAGTNDAVEARRLMLQQLRVEYERLGRSSPDDPHADVRRRLEELLVAKHDDVDPENSARLALEL